MKLKKFRKNRKQKGIAIGCVIALLITIAGVNLYRTFAFYKEEKTFNVLRGVVPDFSSGDVTLAFTIDGEAKSGESFPNKSGGYKVSEVTCDNGVKASWLENEWALKINNTNNQNKIKCTIDFKSSYKETLLAGADPVISGDLIPVKISSSGTVTKADTYSEWYNYEKKQWANAIIPTSSAKSTVKSYSAGTTINEDQIESYFVWIPKYSYQIQTTGTSTTSKAFEIKFGTTNTIDNNGQECKTPMLSNGVQGASGTNGNCNVGEYITHSAFLAFGGNGLWVGKFETGYKDATRATGAEKNTASSTMVVIKPNQYSWRSINVLNAFTTAKGYQTSLNSHMMKNTEWGAVAYLAQSIYGRCTGSTSCTEISTNSNSDKLTGYTGSSTSYPTSKDASTTGNNTGVYDMSGGAHEYVMGVVFDSSDKPVYSNSGFTASNFPTDSKYYDKYNYQTSETTYSNRIFGDATAETKGWNNDAPYFVHSGNPWFHRGGHYGSGTDAGIFYFSNLHGNVAGDLGYRIVLAV